MGSLQCGILVWLMTARCHSRRFWHVRGTSAYPPLATDPKSAASFFKLMHRSKTADFSITAVHPTRVVTPLPRHPKANKFPSPCARSLLPDFSAQTVRRLA